MGIPRINSERVTTPRRVLANPAAKLLLVGGAVISGTYSRDPGNTGYADVLRAGLILGKRTADGKYAPSILGVLTEAGTQGDTTLVVAPAVAAELVRRVGATGTFKLTGPPTAAGVVRTLTVTYSAVDTATGEITITALGGGGVNDVQTFTAAAGTDGGTFRFAYRGAVTAALAWNVSTADAQTALRALHADLAACVVSGTAGESYVVTTAKAVVADLAVVNDLTSDGGVDEGGLVAEHTTIGSADVDGRFVAGSLVQPTDGSETPLVVISDGSGIKVTDADGVSQDQALTGDALIGGELLTANLLNYPSDASLKAWLRTQLRAAGQQFLFDDQF
jgi:hypothetical protein